MSHQDFVPFADGRSTAGWRTWPLTLLLTIVSPAWALDITVDVLNDPTPNGCTPGSCSLREAISLANSLSGPDRILLPATPGVPLQLTIPGAGEDANATGDVDVLDDLEIIGTGAATTTLVQTAADRVLQSTMASEKRLVMRGLTIQGGSTSSGGALRVTSLLTIEDAAFVGNQASSEGGAIKFTGSYAPSITELRMVLRRVRFENNLANSAGGALSANSVIDNLPFILIEDSQFIGNDTGTGGLGGAIHMSGAPNLFGGTVVIRRGEFSANRSGSSGGSAMYATDSAFDLHVEDSLFDANVTTGSSATAAGAVYLSQARSATFLRSTFSNNNGGRGGAIHSQCPIDIFDSRFVNNTALSAGGALWVTRAAVSDRNTFQSNRVTSTDSADSGGGALAFNGGASDLDVYRSTFSGNDAFRGGAISVVSTTRLRMFNNTVVAPTFGIAGRTGTALRMLDDEFAHSLVFSNNIISGSCTYPSVDRKPNSARGNIESPGSTCRFDLANSSSQNQLSATSAQINLGSLADNGGPTPTRLPGAGSIAINQGSEQFCLATDQRHYARNDAFCDVGSVEVGAIADAIFSSGFDTP